MDRGKIGCPRQIVFLHRHETVIASGSPEIIRRPNQGHAWIIQISPLDVGDRGRAGEPVHVVGERGRQLEFPLRRRVRLARADTRRERTFAHLVCHRARRLQLVGAREGERHVHQRVGVRGEEVSDIPDVPRHGRNGAPDDIT